MTRTYEYRPGLGNFGEVDGYIFWIEPDGYAPGEPMEDVAFTVINIEGSVVEDVVDFLNQRVTK